LASTAASIRSNWSIRLNDATPTMRKLSPMLNHEGSVRNVASTPNNETMNVPT
jgi:hypothetical protein